MTLLPYQMAGSGNHLLHLTEDTPSFPKNSFLTPEKIMTLKALTDSCYLFVSLLIHLQKKKSLQSSFSSPYHSTHQRWHIPPRTSKRHFGSTSELGGKVRLLDGSVQKIEGIRLSCFLRTAAPINAESLLHWVRIEQIFTERTPTSCHQELTKICLSLNSLRGRVCGKNNCHSPYVITFDHVCNRKQPFFVRSHGWSSCDPYLTQTRCGLPCRPLLVGDFCLVIIPSEISRPLSPTLQVNSTSSSCIGKAPPLSEGL